MRSAKSTNDGRRRRSKRLSASGGSFTAFNEEDITDSLEPGCKQLFKVASQVPLLHLEAFPSANPVMRASIGGGDDTDKLASPMVKIRGDSFSRIGSDVHDLLMDNADGEDGDDEASVVTQVHVSTIMTPNSCVFHLAEAEDLFESGYTNGGLPDERRDGDIFG